MLGYTIPSHPFPNYLLDNLTLLYVKFILHLEYFTLPLCFTFKTIKNMKPKLLLAHKYKKLGYIITLPALVLMVLVLYFDFNFPFLTYVAKGNGINMEGLLFFKMPTHNFTGDVAAVALITGLLLFAFSQEKYEDERIAKIRLESLMWAVLINSLLIIVSIILLYGGYFLSVMMYNICSPLIIFIIRFNMVMYFDRKKMQREAVL